MVQIDCFQYLTAVAYKSGSRIMHRNTGNEADVLGGKIRHQHPVYRLFTTRTNTIRKHHQRGKISDELRNEALYVAENLRDKALMDNDYAASGYAHDMEQEAIYAQARARLAREDGP